MHHHLFLRDGARGCWFDLVTQEAERLLSFSGLQMRVAR